jgi:hypothetical protein
MLYGCNSQCGLSSEAGKATDPDGINERAPRYSSRAGSGYGTTITCEQASDGTVIEVFEWKSQEAIAAAHTNPVVQKMWEKSEEK